MSDLTAAQKAAAMAQLFSEQVDAPQTGLREALDGLWNAYSGYAGAAEGAGAFQSRVVQRLVEAAYEVIVADKGHPGRIGRATSDALLQKSLRNGGLT